MSKPDFSELELKSKEFKENILRLKEYFKQTKNTYGLNAIYKLLKLKELDQNLFYSLFLFEDQEVL